MKINYSFDPEFTELLEGLFERHPDALIKLEGIHPDQLDINQSTRAFFRLNKEDKTAADVSIDSNANVSGKDCITYMYELAKPNSKLNSLYNLWTMLKSIKGKDDADIAITAEILGNIYINDSWDIGRPYCFNYSMNDIAMEGLKMSNRLRVDPPKSLHAFLRQVEQFTVYAANSTLGATGLADLLIVVAGYVQKIKQTGYDHNVKIYDADTVEGGEGDYAVETYVAEQLTSLIYTLNWEFRGNQSPFTNVSVYDKYFLEQLLPSYVILGEPVQMDVVQEVQEIFLGCMNEVIDRTAVTFPVITACFSVTEEGGERIVNDIDFLYFISEYNLKYGFINIYMGKSSTLSSCCRLRSEAEGLGYSNSFGSGSTKIGSMGVVTLNLPRMAMLAIDMCEDFDDAFDIFLEAVAGHALMAQTVNAAKREFLKDRISRGSLPLYDLGYMSLKKQYSTCGFTGLYEALEILGYDITTEVGLECAEEVLTTIRKVNDHCTKEFGYPHNAEQVPAENSAVKLAQKDHIIGLYDGLEETDEPDYPIYSNQFIPLWKSDASILDRMEVQGRLDPWCDGGSILHINVGSSVTDIETMKNLIKLACKKGVVYFAINYVLHKCAHGHIWAGSELCPKCGGKSVDDLTRVVGFLTSIKNWNKTRREYDAPNRRFYDSVKD